MKESQIATRPLAIIEAKYDLEARQNDIVDMLFTEINKDDGKLEYEINIEKYKKYYAGDTSNIYRDLKKAVKMFEKKGVSIYNPDTEQEDWYAWFPKITYKNKEGKIIVRLDEEFKGILTEVKRRISYDIENPLACVSKYSKRLYYYLKGFEDTGWRLDNLDDLREKLKVPASYKSYGKFKEKVLEQAYKEVNALTDINFEYEEIKEGRKVVRIRFSIKSKIMPGIIPEAAITLVENNNCPVLSVEDKELSQLVGDRVEPGEIETILRAIHINYKIYKDVYTDKKGYLEKQIEYLDEYVKTLEEYKYNALLISALKKDYYGSKQKSIKNKPTKGDSKKKETQLQFNDFEQREYDYDALEKQLLGEEEYDPDKFRR